MITKRKFIKTSILGTIGGFIVSNLLTARHEESKLKEINEIWELKGDLSIYTTLAKIAPLGRIYLYFVEKSIYSTYFNWDDPANKNLGGIQVGQFKYELVDTIEKKIYYWKGLLSFYKDQKISNEFNNIPLNWLIEIFFSHKFPIKDSFIFLGYPKGVGYASYKINPNLTKFIENYPNTNKGNIIVKDMSVYL